MPPKNIVCIVVDRFHAGMIGAYGNTWIHTGELDHLSCESFLFDQALVDRPGLDSLYRGYWLGEQAVRPSMASVEGASFLQLVRAAGLHTALVTDEPLVAELPLATGFAEQLVIDPAPADFPAKDAADTQLARLFAAVTEWLQHAREPFCLWVHARGMAGAWDAPLEFRNQYAEEDDPLPGEFTAMPQLVLPENHDPDELMGIVHAYAGQISLLDLCLGALLDHVRDSGLQARTQLTLLAARGFPLGEHQRVGPADEALYGETVHIPWLMRFPDGLGKFARSPALIVPADLPGTLLDWLEVDRTRLGGGGASSLLNIVAGTQDSLRDRVLLKSKREQAIRTPAWYLRQPDTGNVELYAKPSDRWEVNEVASLLPEVVAGLQAALADTVQSAGGDLPAPLDESLMKELD